MYNWKKKRVYIVEQEKFTLDPNIGRGGNGENEQKQNKQKGFQIIGRDSFHTKHDRAKKFALRCIKSGS